MSKSTQRAIRKRLYNRWSAVIEEDKSTEGYYLDLAAACGHEDISQTTDAEEEFARRLAQQLADTLFRRSER